MSTFRRRIYRRPGQLLSDARAILARRHEMKSVMRGETLSDAFRERLMIAVTEVNACRYCAYFHAQQALTAGLSEAELAALAEGDFEGSPPEERPALLYAQHWAEADGQPDPAARARLFELYGDEKARAIELALSVIRMGNLMGNTFDYVLYRLSFGRWGGATSPGSQ
ncbi:MAG: carboxymuconolactone decarboxylase family protein [Anaerolineae bacterium]